MYRLQLRRHAAVVFLGGLASLCMVAPAPAEAATAVVVRQPGAGQSGSSDVVLIGPEANGTLGEPIKFGEAELGIVRRTLAITPDGTRAYIVNSEKRTVSVLDLTKHTELEVHDGKAIKVGVVASSIAISPDGRLAYVTNAVDSTVSVINTAANEVEKTIPVGVLPDGVAFSPDGRHAYVVNAGLPTGRGTVSVINTATNAVEGDPLTVGLSPDAIAITPDGRLAFVVNMGSVPGSGSVSVIDLARNEVRPGEIGIGQEPRAIAISPDGTTAWVANFRSEDVGAINIAAAESEERVRLSGFPRGIALDPAGSGVYVADGAAGVPVVNPKTGRFKDLPSGNPIVVGNEASAIAFVPDQSPRASFKVEAVHVRPGVPITFDASASRDPDGAIANFGWNFGEAQTDGSPRATAVHTFQGPGTYHVELTLTDDEGCSTAEVFTGQTASCAGGATATSSTVVTVAYPGVRVRCPKKAGRKGCTFKLQAIARKPTARHRAVKIESMIAKGRAKAGRSTIISLKPRPAFRARLATAMRIAVKERIGGKGLKRSPRYLVLRVVR